MVQTLCKTHEFLLKMLTSNIDQSLNSFTYYNNIDITLYQDINYDFCYILHTYTTLKNVSNKSFRAW
jgi:hypothetical protein